MPSDVGRIVGGRWEIERQLARGGMGIVWVARHRITRQLAALKVLYPDGPRQDELHERLLREAAAPAQIGHEGLVRVYDAGVDPADGSMYLAMELLQGETLRDRFARPGLSRQTALQLIVELLEPLAAAHALGFVHRDLKPQNAFLARQPDGSERVKLLDFGLSRAPGVRTVTNANNVMGTAIYTAPEQLRSARTVGPQADVWSVGITLYQVLAGRLPFEGQTVALFGKILGEAPPPLRSVARDVTPALAELVERCLAKDPAARPADASVLRKELTAALAPNQQILPQEGPVAADMATEPMMAALVGEPETPREGEPAETPSEPTATAPPPDAAAATQPTSSPPPALGILGAPVPLGGDSAVTKRRALRVTSRPFPLLVAGSVLAGASLVFAVFGIARSTNAPAEVPGQPAVASTMVDAPVDPSPPAAPPAPAAPVDTHVAGRPVEVPLDPPDDAAGDGASPGDRPEELWPERPQARAQQPVQRQQQLQQQEQRQTPSGVAPPSGNPRDCGPIISDQAARCFLAATGGSANGEYMLRNLILAYTLTGDRGRARGLAARYFAEYGTSPFSRQIRQLGYSP